jgi:hypothetical protein
MRPPRAFIANAFRLATLLVLIAGFGSGVTEARTNYENRALINDISGRD